MRSRGRSSSLTLPKCGDELEIQDVSTAGEVLAVSNPATFVLTGGNNSAAGFLAMRKIITVASDARETLY